MYILLPVLILTFTPNTLTTFPSNNSNTPFHIKRILFTTVYVLFQGHTQYCRVLVR